MENSIGRIQWIDIAKGIGIILVIIGHVSINANINDFIYCRNSGVSFLNSGLYLKMKGE